MLKLEWKKNRKKNNRGSALIESIPVLFMIVIVFNFSLGFFGAIHSGILNSIGAYNYTMETFRFRSNLMYFRPGGGTAHYAKSMNRVHGIIGDGYKKSDFDKGRWPATIRRIVLSTKGTEIGNGEDSTDLHKKNKKSGVWSIISSYAPEDEDNSPKIPEIWIKTVYGICINADCTASR